MRRLRHPGPHLGQRQPGRLRVPQLLWCGSGGRGSPCCVHGALQQGQQGSMQAREQQAGLQGTAAAAAAAVDRLPALRPSLVCRRAPQPGRAQLQGPQLQPGAFAGCRRQAAVVARSTALLCLLISGVFSRRRAWSPCSHCPVPAALFPRCPCIHSSLHHPVPAALPAGHVAAGAGGLCVGHGQRARQRLLGGPPARRLPAAARERHGPAARLHHRQVRVQALRGSRLAGAARHRQLCHSPGGCWAEGLLWEAASRGEEKHMGADGAAGRPRTKRSS